MLTVGRDISSSSASCQLTSLTQRCTPSSRFAAFSSSRRAASAIIVFSLGESGRARSDRPAIAGSLPSAETSVFNACTRCQEGLSTRALLLEWMSFWGPRPQRSPVETSSTSMTPLAPSRDCPFTTASRRARRHEDPGGFFQRAQDRRPPHYLRELRRADLLF